MLDLLPESLNLWLVEYGPIAIFFLLAAGIIALPVPEETLMLISGILIDKGCLHPAYTVLAAYGGCLCGITTSYLIGRSSDNFFIKKWGPRFGLTPVKMAKFSKWFEKYGKWALFYGYFVPGVRHFTGFSAGMSGLTYSRFALFAYSGAIVWASTFLSIGYFFGEYGGAVIETLEGNVDELLSILILVIVIFFLIKIRREEN
jgi:membrane protein DedA with SNARE-associated domain